MTSIEWVKNPDGTQGITWNPITGCLNHVNGLCNGGGFPCYAYKLANTRLKQRYLANGLVACDYEGGEDGSDAELKAAFADPFYPRFWEERLYHPWGGKPKGIFVCDMGDLFGIGVPEEWTRTVLDLCQKHEQNRFYLLTKQPQNLIKFSPFPENCRVGVTACNQQMFIDAVHYLVRTKATVRYISFEPLLSEIPMTPEMLMAGCDWLIIGACTGTKEEMTRLARNHSPFPTEMPYGNRWTAQPPISWLKEIVEAADKAGIKVFLKDNLKPLFEMGKPYPWATNTLGFLRQELPK